MPGPVFLPPRIRRTRKCGRCGLRHPRAAQRCPHCGDLTDAQVAALRERVEAEHRGNAALGRLLLLAAALIAIALLVLR